MFRTTEEDGSMKRLVAGFVVVASMLLVTPAAWAGSSYCESWYSNGEECYRECWHYDDNGDFIGHVTIDYHC